MYSYIKSWSEEDACQTKVKEIKLFNSLIKNTPNWIEARQLYWYGNKQRCRCKQNVCSMTKVWTKLTRSKQSKRSVEKCKIENRHFGKSEDYRD